MAGRRGASPLATAEQFAGSDVFDCLGCAGEQVGSALSILQSRRAFRCVEVICVGAIQTKHGRRWRAGSQALIEFAKT